MPIKSGKLKRRSNQVDCCVLCVLLSQYLVLELLEISLLAVIVMVLIFIAGLAGMLKFFVVA
jgi:hypothetical protein